MSTHALQTQDLSIGYAATAIATGLEISAAAGEQVCLLGPNGVGKSTLIRTLAGLQAALSGDVRICGDRIADLSGSTRAKRLAVVLTDRVDARHLDVYTLVAMGRHPYTGVLGRLNTEDDAIVRDALAQVGALELAGRDSDTLSDGERQRVMLARALAQQPEVLLLDEAAAFLDVTHRLALMDVLRRVAAERGALVVLATHHIELALQCADRVWLMRPGGDLLDGAPEDLVLSGELESVFGRSGVVFDHAAGNFAPHRDGGEVVHVYGVDPALIWTQRALARAGYVTSQMPEASDLASIEARDGVWKVKGRSGTATCSSIAEALKALQA